MCSACLSLHPSPPELASAQQAASEQIPSRSPSRSPGGRNCKQSWHISVKEKQRTCKCHGPTLLGGGPGSRPQLPPASQEELPGKRHKLHSPQPRRLRAPSPSPFTGCIRCRLGLRPRAGLPDPGGRDSSFHLSCAIEGPLRAEGGRLGSGRSSSLSSRAWDKPLAFGPSTLICQMGRTSTPHRADLKM